MSVFDKNLKLPIMELHDQCKCIVGEIVPMCMMHYNNCAEIIRILYSVIYERGLHKYDIYRVLYVNVWGDQPTIYTKLPVYCVEIIYINDELRDMNRWVFKVGVNGIIK